MIISFILISLAISVWSIYIIAALNDFILSQVFLTVLIGIAFLNIFTSFANSVWCAAKINDKANKRSITGLVLSSLSILLFIGYFVMRYIVRIHQLGLTLF